MLSFTVRHKTLYKHNSDHVGLVPGNNNKANITIKQVRGIFWVFGTCKSYVYAIL